jgi:hypothetical protein
MDADWIIVVVRDWNEALYNVIRYRGVLPVLAPTKAVRVAMDEDNVRYPRFDLRGGFGILAVTPVARLGIRWLI